MFSRLFILFIFACTLIACSENQVNTDQTAPAENILKTRVPVEVGIVKKEITRQNIPLTGVIQPNYEVDIISETSGKVIKITSNLGDHITTKDTLAFIDDRVPLSQYRQAQAQVLSAQNNLNIARLNLESDKELYKNGDISRLEFENSELAVKTAEANHLSAVANLSLAEKAFLDTRITSPISGYISRKYIEKGTMVNNGMNLLRVVDLSTLKIEVGIPQNAIGMVSTGSSAEINISALAGKTIPGTIRHISPQADENNGTFLAEVHFSNDRQKLIRAGMTARVNLTVVNNEKELVIPDYALITKNGDNSVYKIKQNRAELTPVSIINSLGSQVLIGSGISEGDTIVVVGMKNLGLNTPIWIETVHE